MVVGADHLVSQPAWADHLLRDGPGRMSAIRIEALQKSYGAVKALDGLDLSVETGSVFGFLGPNGAGKTTTLRILTGLAQASAGRAWVADTEVTAGHGRGTSALAKNF